MILGIAIPEALVMTIDGATLEALVVLHICQEVQVSAAAIAMGARAEAYHRSQHIHAALHQYLTEGLSHVPAQDLAFVEIWGLDLRTLMGCGAHACNS